MRISRRLLWVAALLALGACNDPADPEGNCASGACRTVLNAKVDLEAGRYALAVDACTKAIKDAPDYAPAHYCVLVGRLGLFVDGVNEILHSLKALGYTVMAADAPRYRPQVDFKSLIKNWADYVEEHMAAIDEEVYFLASHPEATFEVAHLPMTLHVPTSGSDAIFGVNATTKDFAFDLGGTWDVSEVLILGSLFNTAQIALDYALAHNLNVTEWSGLTGSLDAMVADLLISNPKLLDFSADQDSVDRVFGGKTHKGLRRDLIAAASYLAGRATTFEGVASQNAGLQDAIRQSAASTVTNPVIKWIDKDANGNPEAVEGPLVEQVTTMIGLPMRTAVIPIRSATFDAIWAFARATSTNAESGGDPVEVIPMLEGIRNDAFSLSTEPLFEKEIPDVVSLDFGAFLEQPLPARELMPYYYHDTKPYVPSDYAYGLLAEVEFWDTDYRMIENQYFNFAYGYWSNTSTNPGRHFASVDPGAFATFPVLPDLLLDDDGVSPTADVNLIPVVALQNPSFGGLLHLDLTPLGGTATGEATHASINEAIARVMRYYCVHFTLPSSTTPKMSVELLTECK